MRPRSEEIYLIILYLFGIVFVLSTVAKLYHVQKMEAHLALTVFNGCVQIGRDWILSTQRIRRGRELILPTQRIPRGRDRILSTQRIS